MQMKLVPLFNLAYARGIRRSAHAGFHAIRLFPVFGMVNPSTVHLYNCRLLDRQFNLNLRTSIYVSRDKHRYRDSSSGSMTESYTKVCDQMTRPEVEEGGGKWFMSLLRARILLVGI
jgi:hypothetical protein